ncbi:MAG TPA: AAA family ATPase [Prolixibacteraceae bacterium]|nr:AAA family ATPase [Prolixibacteraceae bacterium]HPR61070.1 AAA family ATPase [Prolixibacteraceae bacterium]
MEYFKEAHIKLINNSKSVVRRDLIDEIDWNHRLIGIKGFRGVGKTSFLLDYIKENYPNPKDSLYINLNSFYFTGRKITGFADDFYKKGGKVLVLDQIHKYPNWAAELKECYESMQGLQIIFSASPVLRVFENSVNLKNCAKVYHLPGLSFREFLNYQTQNNFEKYNFDQIINNHISIAKKITKKVKPLAYFEAYLEHGYFPYFLDRSSYFSDDLLKHINLALEIDVTYLNQIELKYLPKLRKLLYIIANEVPFTPNISKISTEIETSRATVMNYLRYLKNARLINMLYANGDEEQQKKPVKIYLQNTNFLKTVVPANRDNATYRQTFFYSQVGYKNELKAADGFDFKVNNNYLFNVGGKYTEPSDQNTYSASDRIEIGEGNKIPLWLFGFLY